MGELLHIFDVRKASVTRTYNPETKREKINKFICINIKNFCMRRNIGKQSRREMTNGEKYLKLIFRQGIYYFSINNFLKLKK